MMIVPNYYLLQMSLLYLLSIYYFVSACGGNFTSAQGVIQSPAYRNKYDHNLKCIYVITRPEGYYITINFTDFQLAGNCNADYVEV